MLKNPTFPQIPLLALLGHPIESLAAACEILMTLKEAGSWRKIYWCDHVLFFEYFPGGNGAGLGASHQTGWSNPNAGQSPPP
jgi:hypothetical protein